MSILEDFEKKTGYDPITPDVVLAYVQDAEATLLGGDREPLATVPCGTLRVLVWLSDRVIEHATAQLEGPKLHGCSWCWTAAGETPEAWQALPKLPLDEIRAHTATCEHSPIARRIRELEAEVEELRGRKLGNADTWAEAASEATGMYEHMRKLHEAMKATIRSLLDTELPAGELRRAVGELVK